MSQAVGAVSCCPALAYLTLRGQPCLTLPYRTLPYLIVPRLAIPYPRYLTLLHNSAAAARAVQRRGLPQLRGARVRRRKGPVHRCGRGGPRDARCRYISCIISYRTISYHDHDRDDGRGPTGQSMGADRLIRFDPSFFNFPSMVALVIR